MEIIYNKISKPKFGSWIVEPMSELSWFIYIKSQKPNVEASKVQNVRLVPIVNIIMQNCTKITVDVNEGFFLQEIEIKHVLSNSFS